MRATRVAPRRLTAAAVRSPRGAARRGRRRRRSPILPSPRRSPDGAFRPRALLARAAARSARSPSPRSTRARPRPRSRPTSIPAMRDALLSAHPWSFATGQARLPRLVGRARRPTSRTPSSCRAGFLRALSAGTARRAGAASPTACTRTGCTPTPNEVALTYVFRPDESAFPPFFAAALVARLAAEFCLPLTENAVARRDAVPPGRAGAARRAPGRQPAGHAARASRASPSIDVRRLSHARRQPPHAKTSFTAGELAPELLGRARPARLRQWRAPPAQRLHPADRRRHAPPGPAPRRDAARPGAADPLRVQHRADLPAGADRTARCACSWAMPRWRRCAGPWTAAMLPQLAFTQSADTLLLVHPDMAPQRVTRTSHTGWTIAALGLRCASPSTASPHAAITLQPSATSGDITLFRQRAGLPARPCRRALPPAAASACCVARRPVAAAGDRAWSRRRCPTPARRRTGTRPPSAPRAAGR